MIKPFVCPRDILFCAGRKSTHRFRDEMWTQAWNQISPRITGEEPSRINIYLVKFISSQWFKVCFFYFEVNELQDLHGLINELMFEVELTSEQFNIY